jgi:hypothetical protein
MKTGRGKQEPLAGKRLSSGPHYCLSQNEGMRLDYITNTITHPTHFDPEETLVPIYQTTRCHNPENHNLNNHCRENLQTYNALLCRLFSVISRFHFHHKVMFSS